MQDEKNKIIAMILVSKDVEEDSSHHPILENIIKGLKRSLKHDKTFSNPKNDLPDSKNNENQNDNDEDNKFNESVSQDVSKPQQDDQNEDKTKDEYSSDDTPLDKDISKDPNSNISSIDLEFQTRLNDFKKESAKQNDNEGIASHERTFDHRSDVNDAGKIHNIPSVQTEIENENNEQHHNEKKNINDHHHDHDDDDSWTAITSDSIDKEAIQQQGSPRGSGGIISYGTTLRNKMKKPTAQSNPRKVGKDDDSDNLTHLIGGGLAVLGAVVGGLAMIGGGNSNDKDKRTNEKSSSSSELKTANSSTYMPASSVTIEELEDDEE